MSELEIERINDHTIKFFVPFQDVETRGFSKEEVLLQPELGEELFWEIMAEINRMDEFEFQSPLWVQVHVTDFGLEVMVVDGLSTKELAALASNQGLSTEELAVFVSNHLDKPREEKKGSVHRKPRQTEHIGNEMTVFSFASFEDVIQLSAYEEMLPESDGLYQFEGKYYLGVWFDGLGKEQEKDVRSLLLEFAEKSPIGWARIQAYGQCIGASDGLKKIRQAFFG